MNESLNTPVGPWTAFDLILAFVTILAGFAARAILVSLLIGRLE